VNKVVEQMTPEELLLSVETMCLDHVLVEVEARESTTKFGIIIPDTAQTTKEVSTTRSGFIKKIGPGSKNEKTGKKFNPGEDISHEMLEKATKKNSRILFPDFAGLQMRVVLGKGRELRVMVEGDIYAVVEGK